MKHKILVLGGGLVGKPMALDLVKDENLMVSIADISKATLNTISNNRIHKIQVDASNADELKALVTDYDLIVNAVPGFMGFNTLKTCIEQGKDVVDIAFYPEDVFGLKKLAMEKGVRVIADMGVAPGMSNLLVGYVTSKLDSVKNVEIYVGGLPKTRVKPWEYKAVFSPTDVIEEYTRPARLVENGKIVTRPALTEIELMDFEGIGTLESFNSDGLRSLMFTVEADNMKEKTLRYPGYAEKIKLFAENGFFNPEKIEVDGKTVSPLDFTSKLLFDKWKLGDDETDITVMKIIVEGRKGDKNLCYTYDLYDEKDTVSGVHSMARTTGYSATMAARLLLNDFYREKGITVPEMLGKNENNVMFMLSGLKDRNVIYVEKIKEI